MSGLCIIICMWSDHIYVKQDHGAHYHGFKASQNTYGCKFWTVQTDDTGFCTTSIRLCKVLKLDHTSFSFETKTIPSTFTKWNLLAMLSLPCMSAYYSLTKKKMALRRVQIYLDRVSPQNLECLCSHWQKSKKLFSENVFEFICLFYL